MKAYAVITRRLSHFEDERTTHSAFNGYSCGFFVIFPNHWREHLTHTDWQIFFFFTYAVSPLLDIEGIQTPTIEPASETFIQCVSTQRFHDIIRNICIAVDILDIIQVFQAINQPHDLFCTVSIQR